LSLVLSLSGLWLRSKLQNEDTAPNVDKQQFNTATTGVREKKRLKDEGGEEVDTTDVSAQRLLFSLSPNVTSQSFTPDKVEIKSTKPTMDALHTYWKEMIAVLLVVSFWCTGYYSLFVWLQYFMSSDEMMESHAYDMKTAWQVNFLGSTFLFSLFPVAGHIGDLAGRYLKDPALGCVRVMQFGISMMILLVLPAFYFISTGTVIGIVAAEAIFCISLALYGANLPAFLCRQFKPTLRYSSIGISYNFANAIFAGSAPTIQTFLALKRPQALVVSSSTFLLKVVQDSRSGPAFYIIVISCVALFSLSILIPCCERARTEKEQKEKSSGNELLLLP
jgi:hypothetical protein